MEIRQNRIYLLILLFVVSSPLVHSQPTAYSTVDTWTAASTTNVDNIQVESVSMSDASNGVSVDRSAKIV